MAKSSSQPTSNNERTSVNSSREPEAVRGDQPATELRREGASRSPLGLPERATVAMPLVLSGNRLGLGPAKTPPPPELRHRIDTPSTGRRLAVRKSAYAVRAEGKGQLVGIVEVLLAVREGVRDGATLLDGVATGTLWGWRARLALSDVLSVPVADWDAAPGRTQLERLAVVERALAECGVEHRGGWRVTR